MSSASRQVVADPPQGYWQVTTASHIDWPQQARIELLETDQSLAIGCTVIDSAAPVSYRGGADPLDPAGFTDPAVLAALPAGWPRTTGRSKTRSRRTAAPAPG